jgi:hypothetical protein
VSFVEYLNIPGGQTVVEKRFVERSRKQCLFKKIIKVSKSFVRPFVQPMGRIFGGFPQLSVSLINEKTEINNDSKKDSKGNFFLPEKKRYHGTCNRRAYGIQSGSRVKTL